MFRNRPIEVFNLRGGRVGSEQKPQAVSRLVGLAHLIREIEPVRNHFAAFDLAAHLQVDFVEQQHRGTGRIRRPQVTLSNSRITQRRTDQNSYEKQDDNQRGHRSEKNLLTKRNVHDTGFPFRSRFTRQVVISKL